MVYNVFRKVHWNTVKTGQRPTKSRFNGFSRNALGSNAMKTMSPTHDQKSLTIKNIVTRDPLKIFFVQLEYFSWISGPSRNDLVLLFDVGWLADSRDMHMHRRVYRSEFAKLVFLFLGDLLRMELVLLIISWRVVSYAVRFVRELILYGFGAVHSWVQKRLAVGVRGWISNHLKLIVLPIFLKLLWLNLNQLTHFNLWAYIPPLIRACNYGIVNCSFRLH